MSYKTYTTEAIVCGSYNNNTADKNYLLFSKEGGMLWASARSVREERSKQRCALQDFSHIRVSLVKGKQGWRIGSVESLGNAFLSAHSRSMRALVTFAVQQLRRYVHGEVPLLALYTDALEILTHPNEFAETMLVVQKIFSLRLMSDLGYIAPSPVWEKLVQAASIQEALAAYDVTMDAPIAQVLIESAKVSHL
jgi:recombinational DNA repair protein (RecF pathway)